MSEKNNHPVKLTKREQDVMSLASKGASNKEIAAQLGISHRTVETHKGRLLRKLGADNVLSLVVNGDEQRKRDAEELEDLYQNAPCGYHSIDTDGVVVRINDTELSWLGYERSEIVGLKKISDLITKDSVAIFEKHFPLLKETGQLSRLRLDMCRKDGTILPVLINSTAVKDGNGNFLHGRTMLLDCTTSLSVQEHQREVQRLNEMYRAVVEDLTEIVSRIQVDGTLIFVNESYARFFGLKKAQLLGRRWHPVAHPDDIQHVETELRKITPENPVVTIENRVFSGSGDIRWIQFVNRGFFVNGALQEIQSVGREIAHQKASEPGEPAN